MAPSDLIDEHQLYRLLGRRISRLRKQMGYSQDRLTLESGLSKGTVSRIERGLVNAQIGTLAVIAKTLGLPLRKICNVKI